MSTATRVRTGLRPVLASALSASGKNLLAYLRYKIEFETAIFCKGMHVIQFGSLRSKLQSAMHAKLKHRPYIPYKSFQTSGLGIYSLSY